MCEHEHFTTGELFDWCNLCEAHRLNESWGVKERTWVGGIQIVERAPTTLDLLVRIEQLEERLARRLNELGKQPD